MEEVFGFNIRPINLSQINNFFSSEFAVPGGNKTKLYRMESSTLICEIIVDFKFDKKSKYFFGDFEDCGGRRKGYSKPNYGVLYFMG